MFICGYNFPFLKIIAMFLSMDGTSFIRSPSTSSSPSVISSTPAIILNTVEIPQPTGPANIINSLSSTSRVKSLIALTPLSYVLLRCLSDKLAINNLLKISSCYKHLSSYIIPKFCK